jgi:hypothetical protein
MGRTIVLVLLLSALLVTGCGDNSSVTKMEARFQKLDYEMANLETLNSSYNARQFASETQKYIALVRKYAPQLGRAEARRRLREKGEELSSFCVPCVATLDSEALRY